MGHLTRWLQVSPAEFLIAGGRTLQVACFPCVFFAAVFSLAATGHHNLWSAIRRLCRF